MNRQELKSKALQELKDRGLLYQTTPELDAALINGGVVFYCGFDPTAGSLHIGNLVPLMVAKILAKWGNHPILLVGGATGLVGDPSGKSTERPILTPEQVKQNADKIAKQVQAIIPTAKVVNNIDWMENMSTLEFLREWGKFASVSQMLSRDSVANRLQTGISFTEFTYQLLQGLDFVKLNELSGVTLQIGASDQWGNMISGLDFAHRKGVKEKLHALTCPLMTKSDGTKFGKSETGTVWLDPTLTSPYEMWQFWYNQANSDVARYIKVFTDEAPENADNFTSRDLADKIVAGLWGKEVLNEVHRISNVLFGRSDFNTLTDDDIKTAAQGLPRKVVDSDQALNIIAAIAGSKTEARKLINSGGVTINGVKPNLTDKINARGGKFLVRRGAKSWFNVEIV